ncbi:phospholipase D-like domain-containing protein [Pseudomonas putida]|uniref:phospholipase D-like domain-containing protein n=1 Tax=Pseudomonas putida TaxID=303 RepID=UPI003905D683
MTTSSSITSPIATGKTTSATLNLPWFLQKTEYHPVPATFEPLVNGERAFGALYDAIMAATTSIDYICWGFQPSMHFKRNGNTGDLCIGDLLVKKGAEGVKVRILCWYLPPAQFMENPTPGNNAISYFSAGKQNRNDAQEEYDLKWYEQARLTGVADRNSILNDSPYYLKNVEFATRGFGAIERVEIVWQLLVNGADKNGSKLNKLLSTGAMSAAPTHHQKMVLIDYEKPDKAIGFVMGHNTLDAYWDKDDHSYERMHARFGRNGATPRQDISSKVTGPILEHLNHNFCQAWKRETGVDLLSKRKNSAANLKVRPDAGTPVMAQLLRTQQQEGVHDIKALYLKATNNVTNYIYMENQYFRWEPVATAIKKAAQKQLEWGRNHAKHGAIYLFVVTNSSDEGMGDGSMNTHRMLRSLGREDVMPTVSKLERNEKLDEQLRLARSETISARQSLMSLNYVAQPLVDSTLLQKMKNEREAKVAAAEARQKELEASIATKKDAAIVPVEIPGLKVHICTLVAPDSPPDNWMPVYIHSKLAIIDDVFTTLGSANINIRSMEVDSEFNICHESPALSKPLRQHLWDIHTKGMGAQDDAAQAFLKWNDIILENNQRQEHNKISSLDQKKAPYASLIEFFRGSPARKNLD